MRCPDCNKFVSLEMQDPEVNVQLEIAPPDKDGTWVGADIFHLSGEIRIVRACAECGTELKEYTFSLDETAEWGEGLDVLTLPGLEPLKVRVEDAELEDDDGEIEQVEEGGGRYAKSFFGAASAWNIQVDGTTVARVTWTDKVAASEME